MRNLTKDLVIIALLAALALGCGDEDNTDDMNTNGEAGAAGEGGEGGAAGSEDTNEDGWNATCAENTDCSGATDFCAKQPGAAEGYCTIPCSTTSDCPYGEWSCNVIGGCDAPAATWCGPREEVETFAGIITACD